MVVYGLYNMAYKLKDLSSLYGLFFTDKNYAIMVMCVLGYP